MMGEDHRYSTQSAEVIEATYTLTGALQSGTRIHTTDKPNIHQRMQRLPKHYSTVLDTQLQVGQICLHTF